MNVNRLLSCTLSIYMASHLHTTSLIPEGVRKAQTRVLPHFWQQFNRAITQRSGKQDSIHWLQRTKWSKLAFFQVSHTPDRDRQEVPFADATERFDPRTPSGTGRTNAPWCCGRARRARSWTRRRASPPSGAASRAAVAPLMQETVPAERSSSSDHDGADSMSRPCCRPPSVCPPSASVSGTCRRRRRIRQRRG